MDLVHNLKGKLFVYVLECEPGADGQQYRYVGSSSNVERRMAEHLGVRAGGASWCKAHKPISILEVRLCNTKEEAAAMEVMMCAMHMKQTGYQACRGGRFNMPGNMKRPPPFFDEVQEYLLETPEPVTPEEKPLQLPTMLPPYYEKLKEENGITEDKPPVSAPCFENWKDPDGRLRHLAGIVCQ